MDKIVLGFYGGVDTAVSAPQFRREGFEVHGLYLDNADAAAREFAQKAADFYELPLAVRDVHAELEEAVCAPFAASYCRGETPNPCILCNPALKFRALCEEAGRLGAEHIATGHYARAEGGALYKGRPSNDQSYMLCRLTRDQAARLVLPLGELEKTQTRALAEKLGLPAAHRKDSMEICFIPDRDYVGWLARRGLTPPPGDFVLHGAVVGRHEGVHRWTVGQRLPGLYEGRKLYVRRIDAAKNAIELGLWEELFETELRVREVNWLTDAPAAPLRALVRVRHTKWEEPPCTVTPTPGGGARVVCDAPVRAPAAGQSAVFYDGDRLLGGGFIV